MLNGMNGMNNGNVKAVFDIFGENMANQILPYLDFNVMAANQKQ